MLSVHRYHEISESTHPILNPLSLEKVALVEDICYPTSGQAVLELGCDRGEMLCRFASRFGTTGVGIDVHPHSSSTPGNEPGSSMSQSQ